MIRPLDYAQIFTGVYGGCFPMRRTNITTRHPQRLDGPQKEPDKSNGSTGTQLLIRPLDLAQIFT
jgi:hypothetical protein